MAYTSAHSEHCARHPTVPISALRPCGECMHDPPPPIDGDESRQSDPFDLAEYQWAHGLSDGLAEHLTEWRLQRKEQGDKDRITESAMAKVGELMLKLRRYGTERYDRYTDKERKARLLAEYKALKGVH